MDAWLAAGHEIVDPHVHFWSPRTHAWLRGAFEASAPSPLRRFEKAAVEFWTNEYRRAMAPLRVSHAVYIQANMHLNASCTEEVALMEGLCLGSGLPQGVIAHAPLDEPATAAVELSRLSQYSTFRGVRFMLDYHPSRPELCQTDRGDYMTDAKFLRGVKELENRDVVFDLQLCQCQLLEASRFVAKFPKLRFVLNHAGFPLRGHFDEWIRGIEALAANPNVYCKIGGLGCYDRPAWSQEEVTMYVKQVVAVFGVDRCCFASNLPVDLIDLEPGERYATFFAVGFDEATNRKLFRDNALNIYRLHDRGVRRDEDA